MSERFSAQSHLRLIKFMNSEYYIIRNFQLWPILKALSTILSNYIIDISKKYLSACFCFDLFFYCAAARIYFSCSGSQQVVVPNKVAHPGQSSQIRSKAPALMKISLRIFDSIRILILIDGSKALQDCEHRQAKKRANREKNDDRQRPKARASLSPFLSLSLSLSHRKLSVQPTEMACIRIIGKGFRQAGAHHTSCSSTAHQRKMKKTVIAWDRLLINVNQFPSNYSHVVGVLLIRYLRM